MYMDFQKYFNNINHKNYWIIQYIKNLKKKEQILNG